MVGNIEQLATLGIDAVVGTTGWYDELERAKRAVEAAGNGLIYAANFSLGMQLFFRLARLAGRLSNRLEEYDAWRWSLDTMRRKGLNVTAAVEKRMDDSIRHAVRTARRRGLKQLPAELTAYS